MTYPVTIKLKTTDIYDIDARVQEIAEIRDWVEELVEWQYDKFEIQYRASHMAIRIWFTEADHALVATLKWSNE